MTGESIHKMTERLEHDSNNALESVGQGFAFPVSEKIRNMPESDLETGVEGRANLSKLELFKVTLSALKKSWETAIAPRIDDIRAQTVKKEQIKGGTDFFTEADLASEKVIREEFFSYAGEENLRVFGEEKGEYVGNRNSRIGVRIDPVDGTESMKFGKTQDWSIMAGVYHLGQEGKEKQVIGAMYFPERKIVLYHLDDSEGVFMHNTETGETTEISSLSIQNDLAGLITSYWKHTNIDKQGNIDEIELALRKAGARLRSCNSASADVLEALTTNGGRAIIMDGDITTVDYIAYSFLQKLGYTLYDWDGNKMDTDQVDLTDKKMVLVPPGTAGETIVKIVKDLQVQ